MPWPICDNCADRVYLSHFLEHQPDVVRAMAEVQRIAKPGGEVVVVTPRYSSPDSYSDPTHFHHLRYHSFDFFVRDTFENFTYRPAGFRIRERRLTSGGNLLPASRARLCAAISVDLYEKHLAWMLPARKSICERQWSNNGRSLVVFPGLGVICRTETGFPLNPFHKGDCEDVSNQPRLAVAQTNAASACRKGRKFLQNPVDSEGAVL